MIKNIRNSLRKESELREITMQSNVLMHAEGSCLVKFGNTHVMCSATVEKSVPHFLKGSGTGWLTAEYSMLPRSTNTRIARESVKGISGRTQEIQRLIGRSLRAALNLKLLGERQIIVDCDVLQADGGTRTAAINGGYVAMAIAIKKMIKMGVIKNHPIISQIAAISCGIFQDMVILDLDYYEDSNADVDSNFIFSYTDKKSQIIEVQSTSEKKPFSKDEFDKMFNIAQSSMPEIMKLQQEAISSAF